MLPDAINEELPTVLAAVLDTGALDLVPDHCHDVLDLVVSEEVGNLPGSQEVVDQHKELLLCHLQRLWVQEQ